MTDAKLLLPDVLKAWNTPAFENILQREIERLDASSLPLQQGMSLGNYAKDNNINAMILGVAEDAGYIIVRVGIFYTGMITGCSCADDPTPDAEHAEYCEVQFDISLATAETRITLLS